jgi:predicted enzyme related to lactoylglutathione lyase
VQRVIRFDWSVDEPERAATFYSQVFGWRVEPMQGVPNYWLVTTGTATEPGIDGGLSKRNPAAPINIWTIDVPSVDEHLRKIVEHGGKDLSGKITIPRVGYHAYCQDTESNVFAIIEFDERAA